jgi:hypothetical protein
MNYEPPNPLPKGWTTKTIEEFVEDGRAIGYGVLKPGPHVEGGVRLVVGTRKRLRVPSWTPHLRGIDRASEDSFHPLIRAQTKQRSASKTSF